MLVWMAYASLVTLLVGGAAHLVEGYPRRRGRSTRWVWALALLASALLPWLLPALFRAPPALEVALGAPTVAVAAPSTAPTTAPADLARRLSALDPWLAGIWASLSALLLFRLTASGLLLGRRVRRWPRDGSGALPIRRGDSLGPAVVGVLRPSIVLPAWIDELPEDDRRLILRHEAEHIRAGDPALVLVGYLVAALMPFNAPLWCLFRRLRAAVEEDCDRRVLRGRGWPEQRRYGELLIQIGQRVGSPDTRIPAPAAFAESGSHLERRIRSMYRLHPRLTRTRVAAGLAGGALLLAAACMVPGPDAPTLTEPELSDAEVAPPPPVGTGEVVSDLEFTPFTRAPELVNRAEVAEVVREEYPSLLRDAGIGGQVRVWLYVDESGAVTDLRIDETSGHQELDAAALRVAGEMAFDPALNGDEPVAVWIALPIAFGRPADEGGARASKAPPPPVDRATLGDEPTFTPYTVAPNLRNRAVTAQALEAEYPPELRGAGIGGTARVWFFIDESGGVADARLQESSGHAAIDEAALRVARTMEFSPALNRDAPVPVWVAFPITFMVR